MLADGWSIVILPEGTRESDVPMRRFKPGIGWLVARTGAEVLPIRIDVLKPGLFDGGSWLRPRGHVRVSFGPRIRVDPEQPYEAITADLEDAVREA
jgi:1-acyl-sn-glycerol-3-phosphate acyltransferase